MTKDDAGSMANPMVSVFLYEDGEAEFEFRGETGGVQRFSFTNPELMYGIAKTFAKAAYDCKALQMGRRTFDEVADSYGGLAHGDADQAFTDEELDAFVRSCLGEE